MSFWQVGLLAFALLWGLQIAGTAVQMRHYRKTLAAISDRWRDGFVGSGNARARLGAGAIAIVVAAPDSTIRQVLLMRGRTVFAKFRPYPALEGKTLDAVRDGSAFAGRGDARVAGAVQAAVAQIDRIVADGAAERAADTKLPVLNAA